MGETSAMATAQLTQETVTWNDGDVYARKSASQKCFLTVEFAFGSLTLLNFLLELVVEADLSVVQLLNLVLLLALSVTAVIKICSLGCRTACASKLDWVHYATVVW